MRITELRGNTYHARVHLSRSRGIKSSSAQLPGDVPPSVEIDVDARPSGEAALQHQPQGQKGNAAHHGQCARAAT